jgi:hypothetical protein
MHEAVDPLEEAAATEDLPDVCAVAHRTLLLDVKTAGGFSTQRPPSPTSRNVSGRARFSHTVSPSLGRSGLFLSRIWSRMAKQEALLHLEKGL